MPSREVRYWRVAAGGRSEHQFRTLRSLMSDFGCSATVAIFATVSYRNEPNNAWVMVAIARTLPLFLSLPRARLLRPMMYGASFCPRSTTRPCSLSRPACFSRPTATIRAALANSLSAWNIGSCEIHRHRRAASFHFVAHSFAFRRVHILRGLLNSDTTCANNNAQARSSIEKCLSRIPQVSRLSITLALTLRFRSLPQTFSILLSVNNRCDTSPTGMAIAMLFTAPGTHSGISFADISPSKLAASVARTSITVAFSEGF